MNAAPSNSSTLLIPGFLRQHQAAGRPRLPKLEQMLARATEREIRDTSACLATLFGLKAPDIQPGPFMHLGDGAQQDGGYWLRADPVHLAPDRDQLVLMPPEILSVQQAELQALAAAFDTAYGGEGWHLEFSAERRGYLRAPAVLDAITHDPEPFVGGPVLGAMPGGPDGTRLRQLMNEIQMLFHVHAVNTAREEAGLAAINSLWLWGGGQLPAATGVATQRIVSDLPLLRGLGSWAGKPVVQPTAAVQVTAGDLIGLAAGDMDALERDWFGPLFKIVKSGALGVLDIHLEGLGDFNFGPNEARRFWRFGRSLGGAP